MLFTRTRQCNIQIFDRVKDKTNQSYRNKEIYLWSYGVRHLVKDHLPRTESPAMPEDVPASRRVQNFESMWTRKYGFQVPVKDHLNNQRGNLLLPNTCATLFY